MGPDITMNVPEDAGWPDGVPFNAGALSESLGVTSADGMSVSIHLEGAPDALAPDRLAVNLRIPLDTIRALTFAPPEYS